MSKRTRPKKHSYELSRPGNRLRFIIAFFISCDCPQRQVDTLWRKCRIKPSNRFVIVEVVTKRWLIDQVDMFFLFNVVPMGMPVEDRFHMSVWSDDLKKAIKIK